MPEVLEQPFTTTTPVLASYSGTDIATGIGQAIYYLVKDLADTYFLSAAAVASVDGTETNESGAIERDFDVTLQVATIYEGDAIVELAIEDESGANQATPTFTATIYHYDGTTETSLGTANGADNILVDEGFVWSLKIPVTRKAFKAGDILRLKIQLTTRADLNQVSRIRYDPSEIFTNPPTTRSTTSKLTMPVVITE